MPNEKGMTCSEAGRRGAKAAFEKHGSDLYIRAGKKGGATTVARYGQEHFVELGRKGGSKTSQRGSEFYQEIGHKGGAAVKRLITRAKAIEAAEASEDK